MRSLSGKNILVAVLLGLVAFGFYARTGEFGWLTSEDLGYTLDNPYLVKEFTAADGKTYSHSLPASVRHCFTSLQYNQWIPLPLLVHKGMLEVFGNAPGPQHLLNALLHGGITALVFLLFNKLTGRPLAVALGCLLLALHPQHVQLVAWIAELKDLLAYFFAALSALAYLHHIDRPAEQGKKRFALMLSVLFFAAGLSCRFIIAGLPLLLMTLHLYRQKKVRWEELKYHLILSAAFLCFTGFMLYGQEARFGLDEIPLTARILPLFYVPFQYLEKTVLCYPLTFFNPFPKELPFWAGFLSFIAIISLCVLTWRCRKRCPEFSLAWYWHLAALLPVCGIFTIGPNHYSDHYSYLPHWALFPCFFLLLDRLLPRKKAAPFILGILGIALAVPVGYFGWKQMTPQASTQDSMAYEGSIQKDFSLCLTTAMLVNKGLSTRSGAPLESPAPEVAFTLLKRAMTDPNVKRSPEMINHPKYREFLILMNNVSYMEKIKQEPEELHKVILYFNGLSESLR